MPSIKRILKHVSVEVARGSRQCRRDKSHRIHPGQVCLTISDDGSPYKRSYCKECALPILKHCASDLRQIKDALYPAASPTAFQETDEVEPARSTSPDSSAKSIVG